MEQIDPNHIPGIYNWCDRWCERCKLTANCYLYAQEQEDKAIMKSDLSEDEKMEKIKEKLMETMEMLSEAAAEFEEDTEEEEELDEGELEEIMHEKEVDRIKTDIHPLSALSESYMRKSMDWMDQKAKDSFFSQLLTGIFPDNIKEIEKLKLIKNQLESIQWFQTMIPVKCRSALNYLNEKDFWDDYPVEERAYNGTAKVALLCIQNSINAWQGILFYFDEEEEFILSMLDQLIQMKNMIEEEFPDAYLFVRPGFDKN
jgi:hypothetical protein